MGSCQTSNVIEMNSQDDDDRVIIKKQSQPKKDIQTMIKEQEEEFPNMEEWEGERYKGIGIKKMKGYKCNLPIDKLNEKREEFWGTRNSHDSPNYKVWRVINQACVFDEYRANCLLEEYKLTTYCGCINHIVDKKNNHYIVPNYCINEPYFEKEYKVEENITKKNLKIKIFEVSSNTDLSMEVANTLTGKDLKKIFCEKANIDMSKFNIRMFFAGMEITDSHFLYQHDLHSGYKIQVMKLPKIKDDVKKDAKVEKPSKKEEKEGETIKGDEEKNADDGGN